MAQNEVTISELDEITAPADNDNLMIESVSLIDTKRITIGSLFTAFLAKFIPLSVARGGTGTTDGTLNGVKLAKQNNSYGYMDGNTFKTFRQPTGNATAAQVLSGYSFSNASSDGINGGMTNQGAKTQALNCGGSYTIPAGYHNGSGVISANSLASQTGVDSGKTAVAAAQMLSGYQGWVNGSKISGSMTNYSNNKQTVNPTGGTGNETLALTAGYHNGVIVNRTAPYNAGKAAAEAVTWTEPMADYAYISSKSQAFKTDKSTLPVGKDTVELYLACSNSGGRTIKYIFYTANRAAIGSAAEITVPYKGGSYDGTLPSTKVTLSIPNNSTIAYVTFFCRDISSGYACDAEVWRKVQAKALR